jgi:flavin reductase (DIM6/NTAB) family NADH-FMN oxidoreductase RutF
LTDFGDAFSQWASGVTLLTIADGRDDIGVTVSAFLPVSFDPPLVAASLMAGSYPAELLLGGVGGFAVTVLSSSQRVLAGRFSASGRPGARLMLEDVPHVRGALSGALIPSGGLCGFECSVSRVDPAGDHLLVVAAVSQVVYVAESGDPLLRFRGRYPAVGAAG